MSNIFDEKNSVEVDPDYSVEDAMRDYIEGQELEKRGKELKEKSKKVVLKHMLDNELDKQPTTKGTFTVGMRRTYEYTLETKELIARVDEMKSHEESRGIATCKENSYILFKAAEEETEAV